LALAKAGFVLGVKPISALCPHEETIPSRVKGIAAEIRRDRVQKDPIIVDRESLTVLDGMHRLAAFSALGIENAVCCSVDYPSNAVTLRRWARVYTATKGDFLGEALKPSRLTRKTTLAQALDALEGRDLGLAVLTSDTAYLPDRDLDLGQAFEVMRGFDRLSESKGWERQFVPEDDIDVPLQSARSIVLLVRKLRKDDVINAGRSGKLFPCKTSMHLVDPRPVAVNFPLSDLNEATSTSLREWLKGGQERLLPPDSLYEGRRYKERLLLLNPQ
jgi:hypothetical protein